jgi:anti-repressor protein
MVSESVLYKLILRSDKPEAQAFQNWIAQEVLPTIRATGGYIKDAENMSDMEIPVQSPGSSEGDAG